MEDHSQSDLLFATQTRNCQATMSLLMCLLSLYDNNNFLNSTDAAWKKDFHVSICSAHKIRMNAHMAKVHLIFSSWSFILLYVVFELLQ